MRTAIFVTARLKSTRLPMKAIKPIKGRPMISHLLDRLRLVKRAKRIVLCTSPVEQDAPLVRIAKQENVDYYLGDPEDVLLRLTKAAEHFGVDTIISCTADNPFVEPEYVDRLLDFHLAHQHDFSKTEGLPFGAFSYALSRPAMEKACEIKAERDTEVWGGYFTESGYFRWGTMEVSDPAVRWPELRLTVDTPEDFEFASRIFDELYEPGRVFFLPALVELCRARPDLVAINAAVRQKPGKPIMVRRDTGKDDSAARDADWKSLAKRKRLV